MGEHLLMFTMQVLSNVKKIKKWIFDDSKHWDLFLEKHMMPSAINEVSGKKPKKKKKVHSINDPTRYEVYSYILFRN